MRLRHHFGDDLVGLFAVLALVANAGAVDVEEEWERQAGQGQEAWHSGTPVHAEVAATRISVRCTRPDKQIRAVHSLEHLSGEKREGGAEERTQDTVAGQHRGGKDAVCVDEAA